MCNLKDLGMTGGMDRACYIYSMDIHVYEEGSEFDSNNESPRRYQEAKETKNVVPHIEELCVKEVNIWNTHSASYSRSVTIVC